MNKVSIVIAWIGSALLFIGAGFHLTALGIIREEATKIDNAFLASALEPVWTFSSIHWMAFGVIAGIAALKPSSQSRIFLAVIGLALAVDAVLAFTAIGPFAGAIILGTAGLCFGVAALIQRPTKTLQKMA